MVFESAASFLDTSPSIEDVEREIQFHLDFIQTIRGYRNARLLSTSKLPSDVLSTIFEHLAFLPPPHPSRPYSAWLSATQVCRGWRDVALDTPRMWSCIYDSTSPEFVELLTQRSGSVPLHIRSDSPRGFTPPRFLIFALIMQHASRLREINIKCCSGVHCPFYLDTSFFRNLHTLKLQTWEGWNESVINVLLALRKMERLETLELDHVLRRLGTTDIPDSITAVLPRLTSVRISTHHINTLLILPRISCPNIQIMLAQCDEVVEPDELAPVASSFYSMIPTCSTWRTMLVSNPTPSRCSASMYIWVRAPGGHAVSELTFQLCVEGAPNFQTDLTLCSVLPTRGPSGLLLRSGNFVDSGALQRFLRALDSVRYASLPDIQDIFAVLDDTPAELGDDGKLPSFSLSSLKHICWEQTKLISKEEALPALEQMLAARQAIGAGLRQLTINTSKMPLSEVDVVPLRSYVDELELV